jgi:predicted NBD/HSP70 family sugar kinase
VTIVGIDLGGTEVVAASLDEGELGSAAIEPTDGCGQAGLLDQIAGLADRVERGKLEGVGIGCALGGGVRDPEGDLVCGSGIAPAVSVAPSVQTGRGRGTAAA